MLNSVVVEKVGELHELGFPAFQLVLVTKEIICHVDWLSMFSKQADFVHN